MKHFTPILISWDRLPFCLDISIMSYGKDKHWHHTFMIFGIWYCRQEFIITIFNHEFIYGWGE
jgi:hypothetical protein